MQGDKKKKEDARVSLRKDLATSIDPGNVRLEVLRMDKEGLWEKTKAIDLPPLLTDFVLEQVQSGVSLVRVRRLMGIESATDPRWKKLSIAVRKGYQNDASLLFAKLMHRNDQYSERMTQMIEEIWEMKRPMNNGIFNAIKTLSQMQKDTVELGMKLGVFTEQADNTGKGNGAVTINFHSNVPLPSKADIIIHQKEQAKKHQELLDRYRPKEITEDGSIDKQDRNRDSEPSASS